ncbi:MAG: hypothetical protein M1830_000214 [Pleopsidium flavum]|nr:MAG: hypothetical protein M1830_000214 [Pleopsidium flavum]
MAATPPPKGIYVPVPTFFVSKSATNYNPSTPPLDLPTQASHAIHLAKSGIRGLVVLGSTGEAIMITNAERMTLLKHVRQELERAGFNDYPLIAGTATQSIAETVLLLTEAREAGCRWGLVLAPGYFAPAVSQEGVVGWYRAVADQSPIPIMIYHYPAVSNNITITTSTFETLAAHPNVVGCKLSHADLSKHTLIASSPNIDHLHFETFTGLGQQLLPVLTVGGAGAIDGLAGVFPKCVVHLYEMWKNNNSSGDRERLREVQYKICAGEELVVRYGTVGIKEAVSRIRGFGERDGTRVPLKGGLPGGDREWGDWEGVMGELEALERSLPDVKS